MASEIVLASNETSRSAHADLFHLQEEAYIISGGDILESVKRLDGSYHKLHIASPWVDVVRLATWKLNPKAGDLFLVVRTAGVRTEELLPFRDSSIEDLFPWLYYGKKFDILRKVCQIAKKNGEKHLANRETRVHIHLVAEETNRIIASSL